MQGQTGGRLQGRTGQEPGLTRLTHGEGREFQTGKGPEIGGMILGTWEEDNGKTNLWGRTQRSKVDYVSYDRKVPARSGQCRLSWGEER